MEKFLEFPQDKNNAPIYSATRKKMVVIAGDNTWKDLTVPEGFECKDVVIVARRNSESSFTHLAEGLEFHYRINSEAETDEWIPLPSGNYPFAGKAGDVLGQLKVSSGVFLSVLLMG